ncbi:MAG: hypothetical protein ABUL42_02820 [Terricaulis silvestris]
MRSILLALALGCFVVASTGSGASADSRSNNDQAGVWTDPTGHYIIRYGGVGWRIADKGPYGGDELAVAIEAPNVRQSQRLRVCTVRVRALPALPLLHPSQAALNAMTANLRPDDGATPFVTEEVGGVLVASNSTTRQNMKIWLRVFALPTQDGASTTEISCAVWAATPADEQEVGSILGSLAFLSSRAP